VSNVSEILERFHIPYVERGANVKRGNLNVRCPFCSDDPSHHMGINEDNGMFSCWRDRSHRGRNFARLLTALANISFEQAQAAAAEYFHVWAKEDAFETAVRSVSDDAPVAVAEKRKRVKSVSRWIESLSPITAADIMCRRHRLYLVRDRGFARDDVPKLAARYSLMYALNGRYKERVIFPYLWKGKIVTWSGRSIYRTHPLRYIALEDEKSVRTTKQVLYNYDRAVRRSGTLFLVEGPFDCVTFDFYSRHEKRCATVALSSVAIEDEQLPYLIELAEQFERVIVMIDAAEIGLAFQMQAEIGRKAEIFDWSIAEGRKDPGEFTPAVVQKVLRNYVRAT
jgi:hypothetical protein